MRNCCARMMKLVDIPDLKSGGFGRAGSIPAPGTTDCNQLILLVVLVELYLHWLGRTAQTKAGCDEQT